MTISDFTPPTRPVLVTGATGYVAGWIVRYLLEAGCTVHAAVRNVNARDKLAHLDALSAQHPGRLRYFASDLLQAGSYAAAMAECAWVFHTASPFAVRVQDPQRDLVDPAKLGTRNVLEEASRCPHLTRVVLTSSCAAIYGDNADLEHAPNHVFTEQQWNTSSSLHHQPYSFSKTEAEREAWNIAQRQQQWRLVVLNPSLVMGPGIQAHATSESFAILRTLGNGTLRWGAPRIGLGVVDVRDVALAHLRAAALPQAEGRHIISGHDTDLLAMATLLRAAFGDRYPLPRRALPKALVWALGPFLDASLTRRMVARNVNIACRFDNRKSIRELGLTYRPLATSLVEHFQQLIDSGQLP